MKEEEKYILKIPDKNTPQYWVYWEVVQCVDWCHHWAGKEESSVVKKKQSAKWLDR